MIFSIYLPKSNFLLDFSAEMSLLSAFIQCAPVSFQIVSVTLICVPVSPNQERGKYF